MFWYRSMWATLDFLIKSLCVEVEVIGVQQIKQRQLHKVSYSTTVYIYCSIPFHIPVQRLETPTIQERTYKRNKFQSFKSIQSINQLINQSINWSINQSINWSIYQLVNQSINQINQKSINHNTWPQLFYFSCNLAPDLGQPLTICHVDEGLVNLTKVQFLPKFMSILLTTQAVLFYHWCNIEHANKQKKSLMVSKLPLWSCLCPVGCWRSLLSTTMQPTRCKL